MQALTPTDTRSVMIVTEAHHTGAEQAVRQAVADLEALVDEYLGGEFVSGIANTQHPAVAG